MHRRNKIVLILAAAAVLLALCVPVFSKLYFKDSTMVQRSDKPDVSFSVLSDVHENVDKLDIALSGLYDINRAMDLLVLNGDITDQGLDSQYRSIDKAISRNKRFIPKTIIKNIGNHEFYDYEKGVNSIEDVNVFVKRYLKFAGVEKVYHDSWIKGYHFISMGSEICHTKELGSAQAFISDEQQQWLKEKLDEKYEKGKPIFVFLHQPLSINIVNSSNSYSGVKQDDEVKRILSGYPEIILFTSHTHSSLRYSNITRNLPYTSMHTGTVRNPLESNGAGGRKKVNDIQGVYVEVFKNKVIIKGRDFKSKTWICGPFEI
jgi:3',5'-cyclic AMP phosphodiesterase CpdA